jgi:Tol biopolymer transport system component
VAYWYSIPEAPPEQDASNEAVSTGFEEPPEPPPDNTPDDRVGLSASASSSIYFENPAPADIAARNRIAFVDNNNQISVISPDGSDHLVLTEIGESYRMPTWSPDGKRIAFAGMSGGNHGGIYLSPSTSSAVTPLASHGQARPIYLNWTSDSSSIGYLLSFWTTPSLRFVNVTDPAENIRLTAGSVNFWCWSPDDDTLLMNNRRNTQIISPFEGTPPVVVSTRRSRYRTPIWSADGEYLYFCVADELTFAKISRVNTRTFEQEELTSHRIAYIWMTLSPKGDHLFCISNSPRNPRQSAQAFVLNTGDKRYKMLDQINPVAAFWSPDSQRLAIASLHDEGAAATTDRIPPISVPADDTEIKTTPIGYQWWIYDVSKKDLRPLSSFLASSPMRETIRFFDQFHHSHSLWSPDSRYLLTAAIDPASNQSQIWIIDSDGEEEPRVLTDGTFAVWSWD